MMHLERSRWINGFTSSITSGRGILWNSTRPMPISAASLRNWQRLPLSQTGQVSGWLASISFRMALRWAVTRGESVLMIMPGAIGATQDACSAPVFSSSTRQSRQAPLGARWGSWHRVGISTPDSRARSRIVMPWYPLTSTPLSVMVIASTCILLFREDALSWKAILSRTGRPWPPTLSR